MQKWYNNASAGQRAIIWLVALVISFIIGAALAGDGFVLTVPLGALICFYFELGRRKSKN